MSKSQSGDALISSLFGAKDKDMEDARLQRERTRLLNLWRDPLEWLVGVDTTTTSMMVAGKEKHFPAGRPLIWTTDEKDDANPIKPFPADKPYLVESAKELLGSRMVLVDKARQMMITTLCVLLMDHKAKFLPSRRMLVSRSKEDDAIEILNDKIRAPHERLPEWVKLTMPQSETPMNRVDYPATRSYIRGVAQNVAFSEARGGSASVMLIDEAAFQDQLEDIVTASLPMANQLWLITTAFVGNRGSETFYNYLNEGKVEEEKK